MPGCCARFTDIPLNFQREGRERVKLTDRLEAIVSNKFITLLSFWFVSPGSPLVYNETLCQRIQLSLGASPLVPGDFSKMPLWSCLEVGLVFIKTKHNFFKRS